MFMPSRSVAMETRHRQSGELMHHPHPPQLYDASFAHAELVPRPYSADDMHAHHHLYAQRLQQPMMQPDLLDYDASQDANRMAYHAAGLAYTTPLGHATLDLATSYDPNILPLASTSSSSNMIAAASTRSPSPPALPAITKGQAFVEKLYNMVADTSIQSLISWTDAGDAFTVHTPTTFSKEVLPQYYKHNNWQSFVRQLNMYGFHKVNEVYNAESRSAANPPHSTGSPLDRAWMFQHPYFRRDRKDWLGHIKRKPVKSASANKKALADRSLPSQSSSGTPRQYVEDLASSSSMAMSHYGPEYQPYQRAPREHAVDHTRAYRPAPQHTLPPIQYGGHARAPMAMGGHQSHYPILPTPTGYPANAAHILQEPHHASSTPRFVESARSSGSDPAARDGDSPAMQRLEAKLQAIEQDGHRKHDQIVAILNMMSEFMHNVKDQLGDKLQSDLTALQSAVTEMTDDYGSPQQSSARSVDAMRDEERRHYEARLDGQGDRATSPARSPLASRQSSAPVREEPIFETRDHLKRTLHPVSSMSRGSYPESEQFDKRQRQQ
ncbi:uncharacterized protein L969DRAFT_95463 [Mixia osmundae IAM 14324]|uniref:HSF-type DNA-binding domain-containing protein n=1 Tax=Mixia osmundae (strain CBS 9802 / IAM 14324 / JCM 22182 / KY 12970) TaxID=764103 RepID=G7E7H3_MIXOS|nr:uncharacterized protein L969DRAFT_95463 [Mixia osmundae IAM 14324]KEI38386.1 hypothetical protein L969DRAFT_95463 [Mixia osmundae IAM 14324]GAA98783.1 hypothetical protein E5Q_05471 [Mixia osmundae IAM 14324]